MEQMRRLPRWEELPEFDLYMDQVLAFVAKYLPDREDRPLTASMVNNYVKMGVVPPPVKKKYSRTHIAHLMVICIMKSAISIASICKVIRNGLVTDSDESFYNRFCGLYEESNAAAAQAAEKLAGEAETGADRLRQHALQAALRARAEQIQAEHALARLFSETGCPAPEEGRKEGKKERRSG